MSTYKPEFPYNNPQIIFNSDRITLNSKKDSIFLFSSKIINFSSNEGIHFNTTDDIIMNGNKILLGLNAKEPLVKGNQIKNILDLLLDMISNVGEQLNDAIDSNGNPIINVQTSGNMLFKTSKRIKNQLKYILSKNNFTI